LLKNGIRVIKKKELYYIADSEKNIRSFKPWLGDSFSFLYDFIMNSSIFPKKFGGDTGKHYKVLSQELKDIHGKRVLELATGSGSAVNFLPEDNQYIGTDISPGLLRKAVKKFMTTGFKEARFYVTCAEDIPFDDSIFSICLCILSLNFFNDVNKVFQEVKRVLVPNGTLICSVPVPERNSLKSKIRGALYSEADWAEICKKHGYTFESIPFENGALLYFKAIIQ
jgi:ubiquinone/menaquinone biosynthesis C-methylase UbiE